MASNADHATSLARLRTTLSTAEYPPLHNYSDLVLAIVNANHNNTDATALGVEIVRLLTAWSRVDPKDNIDKLANTSIEHAITVLLADPNSSIPLPLLNQFVDYMVTSTQDEHKLRLITRVITKLTLDTDTENTHFHIAITTLVKILVDSLSTPNISPAACDALLNLPHNVHFVVDTGIVETLLDTKIIHPSILSLLTRHKLANLKDDDIINNVTSWCSYIIKDPPSMPVLINAIKCLVHYSNDNPPIQDILSAISEYITINNTANDPMVHLYILLNVFLLTFMYGDERFTQFLHAHVQIDEFEDMDVNIIDTKLKIMIQLAIKGVDPITIQSWLLTYSTSMNVPLAQKSQSAISPLYQRGHCDDLMNKLVETLDYDTNLLALGTAISNVGDFTLTKKYTTKLIPYIQDIKDQLNYPTKSTEVNVSGYITALSIIGDTTTLLDLADSILNNITERILLIDTYVTGLVDAYINSRGKDSAEILATLDRASEESTIIADRVDTLLSMREIATTTTINSKPLTSSRQHEIPASLIGTLFTFHIPFA